MAFRSLSKEAHLALRGGAEDAGVTVSEFVRGAVSDRLNERIENQQSTQSATKERNGQTMENSFETVGELVTAAIDTRARAWHLDGVDVNVPLVKLRHRIRETMSGLKVLERSQESVSVAKSRVVKAADRELSAAFDFVSEWS